MFTVSGVTRSGALQTQPNLFSKQANPLGMNAAAEERARWFRALSADPAFSGVAGRNQEWLALESERDPGLFDAAVYQFAMRWEERGREDIAAGLYASLAEFSVTSELTGPARKRLEVLQGRGGFGSRAELALRRFHSEALDPATLAGFFAGGLAYRLGRAWGLSRILASGTGLSKNSLWIRPLAATIGFSFEVPAFVLGAREAASLLGRPAAMDSLGKDLASAALVLGPMKLVAAGGTSLASRVWLPTSRSSQAFAGASAFVGIFLGHRLEQGAGLRPGQTPSATAFDSLVTLLQAQVAGGILNAAAGPRWKLMEQRLELRLRNSKPPNLSGPALPALAVAPGASLAIPELSGGEFLQKGQGITLMTGKRGGGLPNKTVGFEHGALAWGGDNALQWLLELRNYFEKNPGKIIPRDFELWWIPESPVDTLLLNEYGMVYHQEPARLEQVNFPSQIPLRAFWPTLRKGEVFVHTADLSSGLGRVVNKWTERESSGMKDLINEEWLELQIENLCRKKLGFIDKIQEGGRDYLLFDKGKRQILPSNLALFGDPKDPRSRETQDSLGHFQNQYWGNSPIEAAGFLGEKFGSTLARGAVISHYLDPRALMLPTWMGPLGMGPSPKFFLTQGFRSWMAESVDGQLRDVSAGEPAERIDFLREISNPKPVPKQPESQEPVATEASTSAKVGAAEEPAGTKKYPSESYPDSIFNAATVPYPEIFPKAIAPEVSVLMQMPGQGGPATIPGVTTGPTAKIIGRDTGIHNAIPEAEPGSDSRLFPLPAPEPSRRPTPVPVVSKDSTGLDPTLELPFELNQQMLEKKPLPFADTARMSLEQMAEARAGDRAPRSRAMAYLSNLRRDLGQVWRNRAWIWAEFQLALYRLIRRQPPDTLVKKIQSHRELSQK